MAPRLPRNFSQVMEKPKAYLFDTHAHLGLDNFYDRDLNEVLQRADVAGVHWIATVGIDLPESRKAVAIATTHDRIVAIVGIHPHEATHVSDESLEALDSLARHEKVVAYGEIGLDFYRNRSPKRIQLAAFREQIRLAKALRLPIVIHDREAHNETMRVLKEEEAGEVGGIIHCFSGDTRMAWECIAMGFLISIPGTVTFKKARQIQSVVREIPLDYLLVETDCPYLTPVPHRGRRNEPAFVRHTAEAVAVLKERSLEEVAVITTRNARNIFRLTP